MIGNNITFRPELFLAKTAQKEFTLLPETTKKQKQK